MCADLELMTLQDKLFSTHIDTNWHGDVGGFLLYWNGLLVKIEEMLPIKTLHLGDEEVTHMLCSQWPSAS